MTDTGNYSDVIRNNQIKYILDYQDSIYGFFRILIGHKYSRSELLSCNALYLKNEIKRINDNRIRRFIQSTKARLAVIRYLKANTEVDNEINKIKKSKIDRVYLSVACIIKNEKRYLREWIEFHKAAGVDRFYIFDNESTDAPLEVLNEYINRGEVIYIFFPGQKVQMIAYNIACNISKNSTRWLGLIDADEFLHSVVSNDIKSELRNYEGYPSVVVNWVVYGPCGHENRPEGLITENYKLSFVDHNNELNCRIKSIVDPQMVMAVMSPHHCWYKKGKYAVDEKYDEVIGEAIFTINSSMCCTMNNNRSVFRINHYWTKSKEELRIKCNRGYPDGHPNPEFHEILKRLDYPLEEDWQTVLPYIASISSNKEFVK